MKEMVSNAVENLMAAIFGENCSQCYPYIVVEKDGEEKKVWLTEAVHEVLKTLPLTKGRNDSQRWGRYQRVLELRFGLTDGNVRTYKEIGQELGGINRSSIRPMEARALSMIRHPSRSKYLRQFFIPSPEEIYNLRQRIDRLEDKNQFLSERGEMLVKMLKGFGVQDPEVEATIQSIEREQFEALRVRFPNDRVWHGLRRHFAKEGGVIHPFARLREMMASGEILLVRNIGVQSAVFLKEVIKILDQEIKTDLQKSIQ